MTNKTTMPEPVAYLSCCPETGRPEWSESCVCEDAVFTVEETGTISRAVVFQDDLEAYANARVREALEEAAKILDNESERYEQKAQEIMHDDPDEVPHMRSTAWCLSVCARDIRALIPKEPPCGT